MLTKEALAKRIAHVQKKGWRAQEKFLLRQLQHNQQIDEAWENCTLAYRNNDLVASDAWFFVCSTLVEHCWSYYDVIGTQGLAEFWTMMNEPVQFNFDI